MSLLPFLLIEFVLILLVLAIAYAEHCYCQRVTRPALRRRIREADLALRGGDGIEVRPVDAPPGSGREVAAP